MAHDKPPLKTPDQQEFLKKRLLARHWENWRDYRHLMVIIAVMLGAYILFSLPWDEWGLFGADKPARGATAARQPYVAFPVSGVEGPRALAEAASLVALGPRVSGTEGARAAADHLANRLKSLGVPPIIDEFCITNGTRATVFRNVLGMIEGSDDRLIVLASHYDTKSGIADDFVGANDSGSSSGLLLELAQSLRRTTRAHPGILLAFLDGEECFANYSARDGLQGSRRLAQKLQDNGSAEKVLGVIVLDMVGDRDLTVTIPHNGTPELISMVFESASQEGARLKFALLGNSLTDDHEPFLKARIPAVDIIDFLYGSAPGRNDYWHTTQDTLDKLSADSLALVGRVTLRTVNKVMAKASSGAAAK